MKDKNNLEALLRSLKLKSFIANYKDFAEKSHKQKLSHIAYLYELVQAVSTERQTRKVERLLNDAKLPKAITLEGFDLSKQPTLSPARLRELAQGD